MEINSIAQAESAFVKLSELAEVCRQLGLAQSVISHREYFAGDWYRFKVAVDEYEGTSLVWEAKNLKYESEGGSTWDMAGAEQMETALKERINALRSDLLAKEEIFSMHNPSIFQ